MIQVEIGVGHPRGGDLLRVPAVVDTGAQHTVLPESFLAQLGLPIGGRNVVMLADGSQAVHTHASARFVFSGMEAICTVLGGPEDLFLIGESTLAAFDVLVDPNRECLVSIAVSLPRRYDPKTIKSIAVAITGGSASGNTEQSPGRYRRGWELEEFFHGIGVSLDIDNRSRVPAVEECLTDLNLNQLGKVDEAIAAMCDPRDYIANEAQLIDLVDHLNKILYFEKRKLIKKGDYYLVVDVIDNDSNLGMPNDRLSLGAQTLSTTDGKEMEETINSRDVFVVHGRNEDARRAIFDFLRCIDLHPIEWSEAVRSSGTSSPYIGEVLDAVFSKAQAVVVLLTPDDEARLLPQFQKENDPSYESQLTGQARPNVLFEAGMALAWDQNRTIIVQLGDVKPFSDIAGRYVVRLNNSGRQRQLFVQRLQDAGCAVNLDGLDWHDIGDFDGAISVPESAPSVHEREQQKNWALSTKIVLPPL